MLIHPIQMIRAGGGGSTITAPTSFWRLEEASGTRVDSVTTTANDLNLNSGTPGNTTGKIGNALACVRSSSQYVGIADNASLSMGSGVSFSFSAWVKFNSLTADQGIFGKVSSGQEYDLLFITSTKSFEFQFSNGTTYTIDTPNNSVTSTGVWYHVVCWLDATAGIRGIVINNGTPSTASASGYARDLAGQFRIGEAFGLYMDGAIDAVGFWKNHVLTSGEIAALYNGGAGTEYSSGAFSGVSSG